MQHKEFRSFSVCINQVRNQVRIGKQTLKGLESLGVRGGVYTPAGSRSKQLPFDQLEGCLIGFAKDGQIVYPWG